MDDSMIVLVATVLVPVAKIVILYWVIRLAIRGEAK